MSFLRNSGSSLLLLVLGTSSCDQPEQSSDRTDRVVGDGDNDPPSGFRVAELPTPARLDCAGGSSRPELCDWAGRFDFVMLGRVASLSTFTTPVVMRDDTEAKECLDGEVTAGLEIALAPLASLYEEAPSETLRLKVGSRTYQNWDALIVDESGEIAESNVHFAPGTTIGVGVLRDAEGRYFVLGEMNPFTVNADGNVLTPMQIGSCISGGQLPVEFDDTDWKTLQGKLEGCEQRLSEAEAAELRAERLERLAPAAYAAYCNAGLDEINEAEGGERNAAMQGASRRVRHWFVWPTGFSKHSV